MADSKRYIPSRDDLKERAETNEPVVDTPILDTWAELDLPMRGEARENFIERVRAQMRERRTVDGLANRIASNITSPVTNAIKSETEDRVRGRVKAQLEDKVGNGGENR